MQIRYNAIRNDFWSGFNMKIEPRHDKTNKMICAPLDWADAQADLSLRWAQSHFVGFDMGRLNYNCSTDEWW